MRLEKSNRVLIFGSSGFFGRLLVQDLKRYSDATLVLPNRQTANLQNRASVEAALEGVAIAICAAGPYQSLPTTLPALCLQRGVHYIDLADDPSYVRRVRELVPEGATGLPAICTGWSTVSALSGLLAQIAGAGQTSVDSIRIQMAPGNRGARSLATITSLLHSVESRGWTSPYRFPFPAPVGPQTGYLIAAPDNEVFRAGSELALLNTAVSVLAWLRRNNLVKDLPRWAGLFQCLAGLFQGFGHDWGALGVEVRGAHSRRVSVVAEKEGPHIAVMPAAIMAARLLAGEQHTGLVSYRTWLNADDLRTECTRRGFALIEEML
jgi:hypothetical protein